MFLSRFAFCCVLLSSARLALCADKPNNGDASGTTSGTGAQFSTSTSSVTPASRSTLASSTTSTTDKSSATTTAPPAACGGYCSVNPHGMVTIGWSKLSVSATYTAATVIKIIDHNKNTTSFTTVYASLPSGITRPATAPNGRKIQVVRGFVASTNCKSISCLANFTQTVTYPDTVSIYPKGYVFEGTIATTDSTGASTCLRASSDIWIPHRSWHTPGTSAGTTASDDPDGYLYFATQELALFNYVSVYPDQAAFRSNCSTAGIAAPAILLSTASFLTVLSTSEIGKKDPAVTTIDSVGPPPSDTTTSTTTPVETFTSLETPAAMPVAQPAPLPSPPSPPPQALPISTLEAPQSTTADAAPPPAESGDGSDAGPATSPNAPPPPNGNGLAVPSLPNPAPVQAGGNPTTPSSRPQDANGAPVNGQPSSPEAANSPAPDQVAPAVQSEGPAAVIASLLAEGTPVNGAPVNDQPSSPGANPPAPNQVAPAAVVASLLANATPVNGASVNGQPSSPGADSPAPNQVAPAVQPEGPAAVIASLLVNGGKPATIALQTGVPGVNQPAVVASYPSLAGNGQPAPIPAQSSSPLLATAPASTPTGIAGLIIAGMGGLQQFSSYVNGVQGSVPDGQSIQLGQVQSDGSGSRTAQGAANPTSGPASEATGPGLMSPGVNTDGTGAARPSQGSGTSASGGGPSAAPTDNGSPFQGSQGSGGRSRASLQDNTFFALLVGLALVVA